MRLSSIIITIACMLSWLTPAAESPKMSNFAIAKAEGKMVVGCYDAAPPFGYKVAGQLTGFDIDIIQMVANDIGIFDIEFVPVTSATRFSVLQEGKVHAVIATSTITRSRERIVDFSIPYFEDGQGFLVNPSITTENPQELDGQPIAALSGSTTIKNLAEVVPNSQISAVETPADLLKAATDGTVTGISGDAMSLLAMNAKLPEWRLLDRRVSREPYGIAVQQGDAEFRDAINEALMAMWDDGRYQLIYDTWFGQGTPYEGLIDFTMPTFPR